MRPRPPWLPHRSRARARRRRHRPASRSACWRAVIAFSSCSSIFDSPSTITAALPCLELLAELLEVAARDAAAQVPDQSAGGCADDRAADQRGREDESRPAHQPRPPSRRRAGSASRSSRREPCRRRPCRSPPSRRCRLHPRRGARTRPRSRPRRRQARHRSRRREIRVCLPSGFLPGGGGVVDSAFAPIVLEIAS